MAGERLTARLSLRRQLWFLWTGKCFETATSHMQTVVRNSIMPLQRASVILYCISLVTPIFFGNWDIGLLALGMGWMGILSIQIQFALPWFANIFYFWCLFTPRNKKQRRILLSITTLILASFAIMITEVPKIEGNEKVTLGIGFCVWLLSFILILIDSFKIQTENK